MLAVSLMLLLVFAICSPATAQHHAFSFGDPPTHNVFESREELLKARDAWCLDATSAAATYGPIGKWDVSRVKDFSYLFCSFPGMVKQGCNPRCGNFNEDLSAWDTSKVMSLNYAFMQADVFDHSIEDWDVSNVVSMDYVFYEARAFNQPLEGWHVGSAKKMSAMFDGASSFNQPLGSWMVVQVERLDGSFQRTRSLSDCNKAKIHAAFSASPHWACDDKYTCGKYGHWSNLTCTEAPARVDTATSEHDYEYHVHEGDVHGMPLHDYIKSISKDDGHEHCEEWAKMGECKNNWHFMAGHCRKSCFGKWPKAAKPRRDPKNQPEVDRNSRWLNHDEL